MVEIEMVVATLTTWIEVPTRGQEEMKRVVPLMAIGEAGLTKMARTRLVIRLEDGMALELLPFTNAVY